MKDTCGITAWQKPKSKKKPVFNEAEQKDVIHCLIVLTQAP